jgi:hypothetical protein
MEGARIATASSGRPASEWSFARFCASYQLFASGRARASSIAVPVLRQVLGETKGGVPEVLGCRVLPQLLDPVVPGQQIGQLVKAVDM